MIPYTSIRSVESRPLSDVRKWRIWGSGDFVHWWNLDRERPRKDVVLELDTGGRIRSLITPDDPSTVAGILAERLAR
jgi:hypothetical protein